MRTIGILVFLLNVSFDGYGQADTSIRQSFFWSNHASFSRVRSEIKGQPDRILYYSYEPVIGWSTPVWFLGLKSTYARDHSQETFFTQPWLGFGSYIRYVPPTRWKPKARLLNNLSGKNARSIIANSFLSVSGEITNVFMNDSGYLATTDWRMDKYIFSTCLGTYLKLFKWLNVEFDVRNQVYVNGSVVRTNFVGLGGEFNIRLTVVW